MTEETAKEMIKAMNRLSDVIESADLDELSFQLSVFDGSEFAEALNKASNL